MARLSKEQELLAFFVRNCGSPPGRTRLMKLLYLADYEARRYMGHPITDVQYIWYDFGPWNHGFYGWLEGLAAQGLIVERPVQYPNGKIGYLIERGEGGGVGEASLSPAEMEIVSYVARHYSAMDLSELLGDVVYETEPMQEAKARNGQNTELNMDIVNNVKAAEYGIDFEELVQRKRRVLSGEYISHADAMRLVDETLAAEAAA